MKQTLLTIALLITTVLAYAQVPQGINYQAVVRDAGGNELANQAVSLRMTILENNTTTVYQETHSATTNGFGLVNLVIGQGTATQGAFNAIDWSTGNYFAQTEADVTGGTNYALMGSQQLMSVPYALYAESAGGVGLNSNSTVTDIDGNSYETVVIGTQEWFAQNLRTGTYANGDPITYVSDASTWGSTTTEAHAHYQYAEGFDEVYGRLYNWYAVSDPRNVCPTGWHVPSRSEYQQLFTYLGGISSAGYALKEIGFAHWLESSPSGNIFVTEMSSRSNNGTGFTLLPGGFIGDNGISSTMNFRATLTTNSEATSVSPYSYHFLNSDGIALEVNNYNKMYGMSVRCIKD
jgi:uncharacterized protein (TIGR02145 family)